MKPIIYHNMNPRTLPDDNVGVVLNVLSNKCHISFIMLMITDKYYCKRLSAFTKNNNINKTISSNQIGKKGISIYLLFYISCVSNLKSYESL